MIKIYSDKDDIKQLLEQLKSVNVTYTFRGNNFHVERDLKEDEFYLFNLSKLGSDLFQSVLSIPVSFTDTCFFVINDNKKLFHDIITKIGFHNQRHQVRPHPYAKYNISRHTHKHQNTHRITSTRSKNTDTQNSTQTNS